MPALRVVRFSEFGVQEPGPRITNPRLLLIKPKKRREQNSEKSIRDLHKLNFVY